MLLLSGELKVTIYYNHVGNGIGKCNKNICIQIIGFKTHSCELVEDWYNHVIKKKEIMVGRSNSAAVDVIYQKLSRMLSISKLKIHLENSFLSLLIFFSKYIF